MFSRLCSTLSFKRTMPTLRSASRNASQSEVATSREVESPSKRKASLGRKGSAKKPRTSSKETIDAPPPPPPSANDSAPVTLVPAELSFSFSGARKHLINADTRFEDVFNKLSCKPFEQLEMMHPFRALTTSIIGQQVSWIAARAINHKFVRLYKASIPEKYSDYTDKSPTSFFPSPGQVSQTAISTLRTAGLSERKAEYVRDLATKFSDGTLTTEKLLAANDEELADMLISVRGIGRWTVDMFAIFSLRRPNILPVGDLGVQRGVLRWTLSLHSPSYEITISKKEDNQESKDKDKGKAKKAPQEDVKNETADDSGEELPTTPPPDIAEALTPDASTVLPAAVPLTAPSTPSKVNGLEKDSVMPPAFTPSIKRILTKETDKPLPALPGSLTVAEMKARLTGKKKIKGAILTPEEMESLTSSWAPYRSLGVYYMWALAEADP